MCIFSFEQDMIREIILWTIWDEVFTSLWQYNTKYYYEVGIGHTTRTFWFMTPPEVGRDVPYTFGLIGIHSLPNYFTAVCSRLDIILTYFNNWYCNLLIL